MGLEFRIFAAAGVLCVFAASGAQARLQPTPPPSGIVVHLFGPNSVLQSVAPALAGAPGAVSSGPGSGAHPAGGQAGSASGPTSEPTSEPTWGNVLHQMFVTGDPNAPNQPARGKTGHQLAD